MEPNDYKFVIFREPSSFYWDTWYVRLPKAFHGKIGNCITFNSWIAAINWVAHRLQDRKVIR